MNYQEFVASKAVLDQPTGLSHEVEINPQLFDFQRAIVRWALRRGRAAIWADCGLGKTPMQLEWARHVPGRKFVGVELKPSYYRIAADNLEMTQSAAKEQTLNLE